MTYFPPSPSARAYRYFRRMPCRESARGSRQPGAEREGLVVALDVDEAGVAEEVFEAVFGDNVEIGTREIEQIGGLLRRGPMSESPGFH